MCKPERGPSPEPGNSGTQISDLQVLEHVRNTFLLFKSPSLWYFVMAAQAKTACNSVMMMLITVVVVE